MNQQQILRTLIFALAFVCLADSVAISQSASLEGIKFTPPTGWIRTSKEGVAIFTDTDKVTGHFCILSIYGASVSAGSPQQDFSKTWSELVIKPFKVDGSPETESRKDDGWTVIVAGSQIRSNGAPAALILTVYSGFGKTVAMLAVLNDPSYVETVDAFNRSLQIDKTVAPTSSSANDPEYLDFDPFPPKPNSYMVHKPLMGQLKRTLALADLAGHWSMGAGGVQTLVDSSTGDYAGTNTTFYGRQFDIRADGSFTYRFDGRSGNRTVRETDTGRVSIDGGLVVVRYEHGATERYRFIAYMVLPKGAAILTLLPVGENPPPEDPQGLRMICGHLNGYISCSNDTLLSRRANSN
jgi:hypothetical protein